MVALAEIEDAHGLPIYVNTLGAEVWFFIKEVNARQSTKEVTPKLSYKYTRSVSKRVNGTEDVHDK